MATSPQSEPTRPRITPEQVEAQKEQIRADQAAYDAEQDAIEAERLNAAAEAERMKSEQEAEREDAGVETDGTDQPADHNDGDPEELPRAVWAFDDATADEHFETAKKAADSYVRADKAYDRASRDIVLAVYDFITAIMPVDELRRLAHSLQGTTDLVDGGILLPPEVSDYLRAKGLALPHFRSFNPFLGIFQSFYQPARLRIKDGATQEGVDRVLAETRDPEYYRKEKQRENTMASRLGAWLLAALDMGDREVIADRKTYTGTEVVKKRYAEWRDKGHPTLALVGPTIARTRKKKDAAAGGSADDSETAVRAREQVNDIANAPTRDPLDPGGDELEDDDLAPVTSTDEPAASTTINEDGSPVTEGAADDAAEPADEPAEPADEPAVPEQPAAAAAKAPEPVMELPPAVQGSQHVTFEMEVSPDWFSKIEENATVQLTFRKVGGKLILVAG